MKKFSVSAAIEPPAIAEGAWQDVGASFERFCLASGIATLAGMMEEDAVRLCGPRHGRAEGRAGHRWGRTRGKVGFHGGKVEIERPRVRGRAGGEMGLPSWETAVSEDLLGKWAMNLMLISVSTRKFDRAVRLPEGDVPAPEGAGVSKSSVSRRFVALSAERMKAWMASDLSRLDLPIIQIDGMHMDDDLMLVGAVGIYAKGDKHPLGAIKGATENTAVVQALLDNLIARCLDPTVSRLFVVDGAKALSKAIRRTFGGDTLIQRCQVHKARNIIGRIAKPLHASVRKVLRQAWELSDPAKAERLIRNLARRLEAELPRDCRGKTPMSSALSGRPVANVSITSSSSMSVTFAVYCRHTSIITTEAVRISRSARIVPSLALYSRPRWAPSSPCRKSAGYTIATNVARPETLSVTEPASS